MPDADLLYPDRGLTKGDLRNYYEAVADHLIRHIRGRPLSMQRAPAGVDGAVFYQQRAPRDLPAAVHVVSTETRDPHLGPIDHLSCDNLTTVRLLADLRCVGVHCWTSQRDHLERPDWMVFDLDPPKTGDAGFDRVRETARLLRRRLAQLDLCGYLKTSGSSGLHVVVPIRPELSFDEVRARARRIAVDLQTQHADLTTLEMRKAKRGARVFLDVLRNAWGQTVVAPYSPRARAEAPVSTPLAWSELDELSSSRAHDILTIPARLRDLGDPWQEMARHRRSIRKLAT